MVKEKAMLEFGPTTGQAPRELIDSGTDLTKEKQPVRTLPDAGSQSHLMKPLDLTAASHQAEGTKQEQWRHPLARD